MSWKCETAVLMMRLESKWKRCRKFKFGHPTGMRGEIV